MTEILIFVVIVLSVMSIWAAARFTRWHRFYGTRFLWGMRLVAYAVTIASMPIAFLSGRRLILGPDAPRFEGSTILVVLSLIVLIGVVSWLAWRWGDLDKGMQPEEAAPPNETRNQREDRQFGAQRRELEQEHLGNDQPNNDLNP